jgi:hypothetical protein
MKSKDPKQVRALATHEDISRQSALKASNTSANGCAQLQASCTRYIVDIIARNKYHVLSRKFRRAPPRMLCNLKTSTTSHQCMCQGKSSASVLPSRF